MHHKKAIPLRNKISLTDSRQRKAWVKRLGISLEELDAAISKVGNSVNAVTKEIELRRVVLDARA
jgi:hypothetical protein